MGKLLAKSFVDNPFFIVGGSRSGTIALLKAIGEHPLILATPSEDPFITDVGRMAYDLAHASDEDAYYYERSVRISRDYVFAALKRLALESALGPHYGLRYLVTASIRERKNLAARRFWCTKTFPGERTAQGLMALYPDTRFVWILRNGMNVVHSRTKFPEFRDLDFSEHCRHWSSSIQRFSYLSRIPEATVVHQEDWTENPDEVFRRIFGLIGVPYHPASTQYALNTHVHPLADQSTTKGVNVKEVLKQRRPPHESWSSDQRATFKEMCGEAMALAGYEVPY
jgi:hypothetical protein